MLQIIGWLGCLYLVVKGIEFVANPAYRNERGQLNPASITGAALAFVGAFVFAALLLFQGLASTAQMSLDPSANLSEYPVTTSGKVQVGPKSGQSFKDCLKDPTTTKC